LWSLLKGSSRSKQKHKNARNAGNGGNVIRETMALMGIGSGSVRTVLTGGLTPIDEIAAAGAEIEDGDDDDDDDDDDDKRAQNNKTKKKARKKQSMVRKHNREQVVETQPETWARKKSTLSLQNSFMLQYTFLSLRMESIMIMILVIGVIINVIFLIFTALHLQKEKGCTTWCIYCHV